MPSTTIAGQRFAYAQSGRGPVTVILETGLGAESAEWAPIQAEVATFAAVFRYDRLGRGESDKPLAPRDAITMVDDLRAVLDSLKVPAPYLFVGHSFGGLLAQVFADRFRADMHGVVLAESVHPAQFDTVGPAFPPPSPEDTPALAGMRGFWTERWKDPEATQEKIDFARCFAQVREVASLDGLPLRVLTTGSFLHVPIIPPAARPEMQARWEDLQGQLVALSAGAVQTRWPSSGHFIQRDNPAAVVAAIRDILGPGQG